MSDPGDGHPSEPTRPTAPSTGPTEPPGVGRPRFGDAPSHEFAPAYGAGSPTAPATPPPPSGPPPGAFGGGGPSSPEPRRDRWWQFAAPIAAGIVVLAGVAFLVVRGGGEDTTESESPVTDEPVGSDEPVDADVPVVEPTPPPAEATAPAVTSPPVAVTTVIPDTAPASTVATPTRAELEASLVTASALGAGWSEIEFEEGDVCTSDSFDDGVVEEAVVVFEQDATDDEFVIRQLTHIVTSYADEEAAAGAFAAEIEAIAACGGTTVDFDGLEYDVQVAVDSFDEATATEFACSDDDVSVIVEFTNDAQLIPYIGQALIAFRCGLNLVAVSFASTVDLADLSNQRFFEVAGQANTDTATLPGS